MEHLRQLVANIALAQDATAVGPNEINPDRLEALKRKADKIWDEDAKKYDMLHMQFQQHGTVRYNGGSWEVVERSEDGTKLTIKKGDNVPVVVRTPHGFANSLKTNVETYNNNTNDPALEKRIAWETHYLINPPYKNPVYWTWLHRGDAYGLDATKAEAQKRTKAALLALQNNLFGYSPTNTTFTEDFEFRFMPAWTGNAVAGGLQYDPTQEAGNLSQRYEIVTAIILGLGALLKFESDAKKPDIKKTRTKFQKEQTFLDSKLSSRARDVQRRHHFVQQYKSLHRRGELKGRIKHLESTLEIQKTSIENQKAYVTECYEALNKQNFEGAKKWYTKLYAQGKKTILELVALKKIEEGIGKESDILRKWNEWKAQLAKDTKDAKDIADAEAKARAKAEEVANAKERTEKAKARFEAMKAAKAGRQFEVPFLGYKKFVTTIKEGVQVPPNRCIIDELPCLKRTYIRNTNFTDADKERRKENDARRTHVFVAKMKTFFSDRIPAQAIITTASIKEDVRTLNLLRVFMVYAINWYEDSSEPNLQKGIQLNAVLGTIGKILTGCTSKVLKALNSILREDIRTNNAFPFFKITKQIKDKKTKEVMLSIVDANELKKLGEKEGQIIGINASGKKQEVDLAEYNVTDEDYIRFLGVKDPGSIVEMPEDARNAIKAWWYACPAAIDALIRKFGVENPKRKANDGAAAAGGGASGGGPAKKKKGGSHN